MGLRYTVECQQDPGDRITHWVHVDGIRRGQNAQLSALTSLRSGSVAACRNGFDRSLRFAWQRRRKGRPHIPMLSREHHRPPVGFGISRAIDEFKTVSPSLLEKTAKQKINSHGRIRIRTW